MERQEHWNTICLGIVTVATAAVGTAVFASVLTNIDISSKDLTQLAPDVAKAFFAGTAIILYVFVGTLSGIAMFRVDDEATPDARADDKRSRMSLIY